jgi:hypothetical protein
MLFWLWVHWCLTFWYSWQLSHVTVCPREGKALWKGILCLSNWPLPSSSSSEIALGASICKETSDWWRAF